MMHRSHLVTLLLTLTWLLSTATASAQQTTHLQGCVYLNDTLPAAYATLYLPQYGIGTVTDDQGHYQLDDVPVGPAVTLEYAYLGYKTEQVRLALTQPNHRYAHDHHMTEQAIELNEVYLTPNGEDPCVYILRKLHEQGRVNRKRLQTYDALCSGKIDLENLDLIVAILPGFIKTMLHGLLRVKGVNALFNYITSSDHVKVDYQYTQTWRQGKARNTEMTILSSSPKIDNKCRRQLSKLQVDDFFTRFYGEDKSFDAKKVAQKIAKKNIRLKGVIEEKGKTIDVLTQTTGDSAQTELTIYIIEDLWSVLRFEQRSSDGGLIRFECDDIGGGIYLPVLFATPPIALPLDKLIDETKKSYQEEKAKGNSASMEKKVLERYEATMQQHSSSTIRLVTPFSVRYSNVSIR